jgi:hypothetical protein
VPLAIRKRLAGDEAPPSLARRSCLPIEVEIGEFISRLDVASAPPEAKMK